MPIRSVITACKRNILLHSDQFKLVVLLYEYKFLMTFINKKHLLTAENLNVISFRDFQNFKKRLIIQ